MKTMECKHCENYERQLADKSKTIRQLIYVGFFAVLLLLVSAYGLSGQKNKLTTQCTSVCSNVLSGGKAILDLGNTTTYCDGFKTAYLGEDDSLMFDCRLGIDNKCICAEMTETWPDKRNEVMDCKIGVMVTWPEDGSPMFLDNTTHGPIICESGRCTTRVCATTFGKIGNGTRYVVELKYELGLGG